MATATTNGSAFPALVTRELWAFPRDVDAAEQGRQFCERLKAVVPFDHLTLVATNRQTPGVDTHTILYSTWPVGLLDTLLSGRGYERDALLASLRGPGEIVRPAEIDGRSGTDPVMRARIDAFARFGVPIPHLFLIRRFGQVVGCLVVSRAEPFNDAEEAFLAGVAPGLYRALATIGRTEPRTRRTLTPKELECLRWASVGKTSEETARLMGISATTVETHFKNAATKLAVRNRVHTVAEAMRRGWIP